MQTMGSVEPVSINWPAQALFSLSFWASIFLVSAIIDGNLGYTLKLGFYCLLTYQLAFMAVCEFDSFPINAVLHLRIAGTGFISLSLMVLMYVFNSEHIAFFMSLPLLIILLEIVNAIRIILNEPYSNHVRSDKDIKVKHF